MKRDAISLMVVVFGLLSASAFAAEPFADAELRSAIDRLRQAESQFQTPEWEAKEMDVETTPTSATTPEPTADAASDAASLFLDEPAFAPPADPVPDFSGPPGAAVLQLDPVSAFEEPTPGGFEERFQELIERQDALEAENAALAGRLSKGVVFPGSTNVTMQVSGRVHGDYWAFPGHDDFIDAVEEMDPQDRFVFRRVRFGVRGTINDNMIYKIEMEFAGANDTEYRDVFLGWTDLPVLQTVLVGNQKRPYGLDHLNSSRFNVFLERPFVIEGFNQDARRLGVVSYGVSEDLDWNWRYGVYNMELTQDDPGYVGDHYQLEFAGRLANTWWYDEASDGRGYGHWAISGTVAHPDGDGGPNNANEARFRTRPEARSNERWLNTGRIAGADYYELIGLEKVFNAGPLQVVGELQNVFLQRSPGSDLRFWGGYVYVAYFLTGEHMPWDREDGTLDRPRPFENFFLVERCRGGCGGGWGAWQIAARYSYADFSDDDILGGVGNSITLGLNWYWNPNARLQFNYIHGWVADHEPLTPALLTEGEYDIIGMRAMVDF